MLAVSRDVKSFSHLVSQLRDGSVSDNDNKIMKGCNLQCSEEMTVNGAVDVCNQIYSMCVLGMLAGRA